MDSISKTGKWAFVLGGITLILFSSRVYILDLIEPAKSLGQRVGETALDIYNTVKESDKREMPASKRTAWSHMLILTSFVLLVTTAYFSIESISKDSNKWFGIFGGLLGTLGLVMFLANLTASIVGSLLILVLGAALGIILLYGSS